VTRPIGRVTRRDVPWDAVRRFTVNLRLTVNSKVSRGTYTPMVAVTCTLRARRAADLTRGRRLYACPRSGGLPRSTALARWSRREGSPCQIRRGSVTSPGFSGPAFAFRASRPGARGQLRGSGAGARLRRPESAARAAPWGRLETVQEVLTGIGGTLCQAPLDVRHRDFT
jgi:hypothetical protein